MICTWQYPHPHIIRTQIYLYVENWQRIFHHTNVTNMHFHIHSFNNFVLRMNYYHYLLFCVFVSYVHLYASKLKQQKKKKHIWKTMSPSISILTRTYFKENNNKNIFFIVYFFFKVHKYFYVYTYVKGIFRMHRCNGIKNGFIWMIQPLYYVTQNPS